MAHKKRDLDYFLAQARRISEHRELGAEREIRKVFKELALELNAYIADVHARFAAGDGTLKYADLESVGYTARFLDEIEQRIYVCTPKTARVIEALIDETYRLAYESMIHGVAGQDIAGLTAEFGESLNITPEQIKNSVHNPLMQIALEKNHRDIVYDIKRAVAIGLMNGDRYTTIARQINVALDRENGPYRNAIRIARTEVHRVREAGNHDAAVYVDEELQKGTTGRRMVKTWKTMRDERVRPQNAGKRKKGEADHVKMEGQTVLEIEPFDLGDYNGQHVEAMMPGNSGVAAHDIHCRCYASRKMMTDEEYFALTGKHFPG